MASALFLSSWAVLMGPLVYGKQRCHTHPQTLTLPLQSLDPDASARTWAEVACRSGARFADPKILGARHLLINSNPR